MRIAACLLALICAAACTAAKPKPAASAVSTPPTFPPLQLKADGPSVAYEAPAGWLAMRPEKPAKPIILVRPGDKDEAISLLLQETSLDDTLEAVTVYWATMAAKMLKDFQVTSLEPPTYPSDGESRIVIHAVDGANRALVLLCRIKNVGNPEVDYWTIVLLIGRDSQTKELMEIGDKLMKSLKIKAAEPPK